MKTYMKFFTVIAICVACFMTGCQKDTYFENTPIENEIVNSIELEEYIIAASDFKQTLAVFEKEISKVDFSKLEVTYDTDGREIMRLPVSVGSIRIEENNANYVEVYIIRHLNGTISTFIDDRNTPKKCYLPYAERNGQYYINGQSSPIASIAHTHKDSGNASAADIAEKAKMPGIPRSIYYNGIYHAY
jgi:hypothetical protein